MIKFQLSEGEEREKTCELISFCHFVAFGESNTFEHNFASDWEHVYRCFGHFDHLGGGETGFKATKTKSQFFEMIVKMPLSELPLIEDLLDVALSLNEYKWTTRETYTLSEPVSFHPHLESILRGLRLLDFNGLPSRKLALYLLHKYHFHHYNEILSPEIDKLVEDTAENTWRTAPAKFRADFITDMEIAPNWHCGQFSNTWRFGRWLDNSDTLRTYIEPNPNGALFWLIPHKIQNGLGNGRLS